MKILVLGGAGYIGSHTVYRLIESGNEVVVFDNLETGHIEAVHPKAKFYKGDLRNRSEIDSVFDKEKGIDAVIHFAANSLVGESMTNPLKYYDNTSTAQRFCFSQWLLTELIRLYFHQQRQHTVSLRELLFLKPIRQIRQTATEKQKNPWRECSIGLKKHMV
mgnify:CR=1 FL=1